MSRILVTGAAGFIGLHVSQALLKQGHEVLGLDNLNPYYDPQLKERRLALLERERGFRFVRASLEDGDRVARLFSDEKPELVVHLAAQPGVRYSIENPRAYIDSNLVGFLSVLEGCRRNAIRHLVFASSSSVYGGNTKVPFSVRDNVDHPVSLYAATKKANELMAHSYSHLYGLPVTGLRYFTVYGPWGRPDMAPMLFAAAISEGRPFNVFNHGRMRRDFTFISDIAEGTVRVLLAPPPSPDPRWSDASGDPSSSNAPYRIYNIGNHAPVELLEFIRLLERAIGREARMNFLPMQNGDVPATFADVAELERDFGIKPKVSIEEGVARFVTWFTEYRATVTGQAAP
jgi:UDP-glucuronate 4-epimerase